MAPSFSPSIVVVSGASRGFGLAAATQLSRAYPNAALHLMASSVQRLEATKRLLTGHLGPIQLHGVELSKLASGDTTSCTSLMQALSAAQQQKILFVHSAAVLGPTGAVEKLGPGTIAAVSQAVQVGDCCLWSIHLHAESPFLPIYAACMHVKFFTCCPTPCPASAGQRGGVLGAHHPHHQLPNRWPQGRSFQSFNECL